MSTALQKPWMKDLPPPVVKLAKDKAIEATKAWNGTVSGILSAARAVFEVREKIGQKGSGTFGAWAEEELKRSQETASRLAAIGAKYDQFIHMCINLPPSWGTLYEMAKEQDDKVFRAALRRVRPEMERAEVFALVAEARQELAPAPRPKPRVESRASSASGSGRSVDAAPRPPITATATPEDAAKRLTVNWKAALTELKATAGDLKRDKAALSPEAKQFILHNYVQPMQALLKEAEQWLASV